MSAYRDRTAWLLGGAALCIHPPSVVTRARRIVLVGPPGVGKTTQAALLSGALGACPLSTGDLFRSAHRYAIPPGSAMAEAEDAMQHGRLVPDDIVISAVRDRTRCLQCSGGFLLDGFPRTVPQAISLDTLLTERGIHLDAVFGYVLPDDLLVERLSDRRICPRCHTSYHLRQQPPRQAGHCDHCGGPLRQRADDRPSAIRERLRAEEEAAAGVRSHYARSGLLIAIAAEGTPQEVLERSLAALTSHVPAALGKVALPTPGAPTRSSD